MPGGTNVENDNKTSPDLTNFKIVGLGYVSVADAPDAADYPYAVVVVTDGAAGDPILAFSDGTDWLRSDTGAAVSES